MSVLHASTRLKMSRRWSSSFLQQWMATIPWNLLMIPITSGLFEQIWGKCNRLAGSHLKPWIYSKTKLERWYLYVLCMLFAFLTIIHQATSQGAPTTTESTEDLATEEMAWLNVTEHNNLAKCLDTCVDRWQNAGPEAHKKMFALFAIAGIFLVVCRHGHVLVICDMIRSGELYVSFSGFPQYLPHAFLEWSIHWPLSNNYTKNSDSTSVSVTTSCVPSGQPYWKAPLELRP